MRQLRDYQLGAIEAWNSNGNRGILAMATGTGKTFTSLAAVDSFVKANADTKLVLIVAPFQHLADQWCEEMAQSGIRPVRAYESTARWRTEWTSAVRMSRAVSRPLYAVTTYSTLSGNELLDLITPLAQSTLLVADECHYLGSERSERFMELPVSFRLGLSATPQRHFDEKGTQELVDYFGGIVFSFGMKAAIEQNFLTPYDYYPEPVEMTAEEFVAYRDLTDRISTLAARANSQQGGGDSEEQLKRLLQMRSRLMNNSTSKIEWLRSKLKQLTPDELKYTLVYVGDVLFDDVLSMVGRELGVPAHAFTSRQSRKQRAEILEQFQSGELSILVAMKCLDEGVDVPPTRTAYFLASTSNPREFVQRRGRILRRSPGKEAARIYDAIAVPPLVHRATRLDRAEQATLRTQFSRIQEFGGQARNHVQADAALFNLRMAANLPAVE